MRRTNSAYGLLDLMFNLSLAFAFLLIMAIMLISEQKKKEVERPAEFLITITWAEQSTLDVDLHVMHDTTLSWVNYSRKRSNHMFLEQDDRGRVTDMYTDPDTGVEIYTPINREVVTVRQKVRGMYAVNVHMFTPDHLIAAAQARKSDQMPIPVEVEVLQLNPYRILHQETVFLTKAKEQKTAVIFHVDDGRVTEVDTLTQIPFVYRGLGISPGFNQ